jgi:tetratricopeptide (TPR) repeat protein
VLLDRVQAGADRLLDFLDADTSFSLVFLDDAAAVYVRRQGTLSPVAERFGYRFLPAGAAGRRGRLQASLADSALRRPVIAELEREASGSRWNATASSALADLALFEGRLADARESLLRVLEVMPRAIGTHGRLGRVALAQGRPREALRESERERTVSGPRPATLLGIANAWRRLGESDRARAWYQRTLAHDPGNQEARDSLATLGAESSSPR